ncbi:hypothetical protein [Aestuariivirga sp.]|uniref:hypothetical protein n=1 Tax=Aestuariivirga sp. TaxID=2650926 RepID=UPI00391C82A1
MASEVHWVNDGRFQPELEKPGAAADERALLQRQGYVKIVESDTGTTVRWSMFSANWASLFFVTEWIHGARGPFQLQYYSAGWFNERYEHSWEAADRIHHLIYKSDVHLSQTVYIQDAPENREDVPMLLQKALHDNAIDEDYSIDCMYDPSSQKFRVTRVGPQSTIAKLWGMNPVSYPCLTGHSYDQAVSRVYPEVSRTGEPHYDHIYAAMASANGDVVWVPYQRVVLPLKVGRNKKAVRVVTELAKVDISPL